MASGSSTKVELLTRDLKCEGSNLATADNGGLYYKKYGSVMYGFGSKLVCWSKLVCL
jgi:hypothetical protein